MFEESLFDDPVDPFAETESTALADHPDGHILIIDDDHDQTGVLAHHFARQGYRVSVAHNCHDGESSARADHPDLIPDGHQAAGRRWLGGMRRVFRSQRHFPTSP